jgi:hypothetical protein
MGWPQRLQVCAVAKFVNPQLEHFGFPITFHFLYSN